MPQEVCFCYGLTGHIRRNCLTLSKTGLVGQSSVQPRALVQGCGHVRSKGTSRFEAESSSKVQGHPDSVIGITVFFIYLYEFSFDF